jgi:hypothetical protein
MTREQQRSGTLAAGKVIERASKSPCRFAVKITGIFRSRGRIVSRNQSLDDLRRPEKREENERKWKYGRFTRVALRPASHAES